MQKISKFVFAAIFIVGIFLVYLRTQVPNTGLEGYTSLKHSSATVPLKPDPNHKPVDDATTAELMPKEAPEISEPKKVDDKEKSPAKSSPTVNDKNTHDFLKSKVDNGFIIVAVANNGHRDFVRNWVEGMKRNIKNNGQFVIVCLDKELYGYLKSIEVPALPVTSIVRDQVVSDSYEKGGLVGEKVWMTEDYHKLVNLKIDVVKNILEIYKMSVIFSDVDLVWINPKISEYLKHMFETGFYDFIYSLDHWRVQDVMVCTGFYAVQPTDFAINFLGKVMTDPRRTMTHDQDITQTQLRALSADDKRRFGYLPLLWFQNGQAVDLKLSKEYTVKPWLVHANFRIGSRDKADLLKSQNLWYLESK